MAEDETSIEPLLPGMVLYPGTLLFPGGVEVLRSVQPAALADVLDVLRDASEAAAGGMGALSPQEAEGRVLVAAPELEGLLRGIQATQNGGSYQFWVTLLLTLVQIALAWWALHPEPGLSAKDRKTLEQDIQRTVEHEYRLAPVPEPPPDLCKPSAGRGTGGQGNAAPHAPKP